MSYGCSVCARCGGEVRVYEGDGGNCPHCGAFVCAGTFDSIAYEMEKEQRHDEEVKERMKHVTKIVVVCSEVDDDRSYEWSKEFTNSKDADEWARKQSGYVEYRYYDEKGLIW